MLLETVEENTDLAVKALRSSAKELALHPEGRRVLVTLTRTSLASDAQLIILPLGATRSRGGRHEAGGSDPG